MRARLRGLPIPPPLPGEPTLWDQAAEDFWWLERFRLTPGQVDDLPLATYELLPEIAAVADEIGREKRGEQ